MRKGLPGTASLKFGCFGKSHRGQKAFMIGGNLIKKNQSGKRKSGIISLSDGVSLRRLFLKGINTIAVGLRAVTIVFILVHGRNID
jgi:hypothetical protein